MARYHVQTAYSRFKVRYEESRAQCGHYVLLLSSTRITLWGCAANNQNKFWKIKQLHNILFVKKKNTAHAAQRWFCRVNRRQNESGVLRGGKFFCGLSLTEVVGLTVITNHFLWLYSKWTRPYLVDGFEPIYKISGIYKKNTTVCGIRQEGFGKFMAIKWRE